MAFSKVILVILGVMLCVASTVARSPAPFAAVSPSFCGSLMPSVDDNSPATPDAYPATSPTTADESPATAPATYAASPANDEVSPAPAPAEDEVAPPPTAGGTMPAPPPVNSGGIGKVPSLPWTWAFTGLVFALIMA